MGWVAKEDEVVNPFDDGFDRLTLTTGPTGTRDAGTVGAVAI